MSEPAVYTIETVTVDESRTMAFLDEWRREAVCRLRSDLLRMRFGQSFRGHETDPNAAFIVGVMQKHFRSLAMEPTADVLYFPHIREDRPCVEGLVCVYEGGLSQQGLDSLEILRCVADSVTETEKKLGWYEYSYIRFEVSNIWQRWSLPGGAYSQWLQMTFG